MALLAATFAALVVAAGQNDPEPPRPARAGPQQAAGLDPERLIALSLKRTPAVSRRVARLRELRFERPVKPRLASVADLRALAERQLDRPEARAELRVADVELRLLGLLEPGESLGEVATDTTALAAAFYDPRRGRLFVVGDAVPAGPALTEFVLAHELTHALEDQRYGLPEPKGVSDDRALAQSALVEGTATALMTDYAARHLDPFALAAEAGAVDGGTGGLPRFALAEVEFAYFGGAEFVARLRDVTGDWKLVDYAYEARAPATTEQVIHPEKYLDDERPLAVAGPRRPGPGWRPVDDGVVGEFATTQILAEGVDEAAARDAAAGWGGDSYRLWEGPCGGECSARHALGIAWRWDTLRDAREFERALETYLEDGLRGDPRGDRVWAVDSGFAATTSAADAVRLGFGPTPATARAAAAAK